MLQFHTLPYLLWISPRLTTASPQAIKVVPGRPLKRWEPFPL